MRFSMTSYPPSGSVYAIDLWVNLMPNTNDSSATSAPVDLDSDSLMAYVSWGGRQAGDKSRELVAAHPTNSADEMEAVSANYYIFMLCSMRIANIRCMTLPLSY